MCSDERIFAYFELQPAPTSQDTCLYRRLNAALRSHGKRDLKPFLPYMKLLLSALYQLPLVQVPTYRGVKLELFEVRDSLKPQTLGLTWPTYQGVK